MREATVTLNGEEYTIQERRRKENRAWRDKLEGHFSDVVAVLEEDIDELDGLACIVNTISKKVLGSVDLVVQLVADYAPALPLDSAYESEIIEAFWAVLGLAYPFGFEKLVDQIRGLVQRGLERQSTKQS